MTKITFSSRGETYYAKPLAQTLDDGAICKWKRQPGYGEAHHWSKYLPAVDSFSVVHPEALELEWQTCQDFATSQNDTIKKLVSVLRAAPADLAFLIVNSSDQGKLTRAIVCKP